MQATELMKARADMRKAAAAAEEKLEAYIREKTAKAFNEWRAAEDDFRVALSKVRV